MILLILDDSKPKISYGIGGPRLGGLHGILDGGDEALLNGFLLSVVQRGVSGGSDASGGRSGGFFFLGRGLGGGGLLGEIDEGLFDFMERELVQVVEIGLANIEPAAKNILNKHVV